MHPAMSSDWVSSPQGHAQHHEYETVAELYLSNKNSSFANMRKLQSSQQRKKNNDKRDSVAQLSPLGDASPKKLREKTSWLGMSRGYATTASGDGHWARVRCTLVEMEDTESGPQWRLTIIGDKGNLQHSLNVKALRATDIRFADRSLFFRSDCLSIHASPSAFLAHSPSLQTLIPAASDHTGGRGQTHQRQLSSTPQLDPIYLAFECRDAANCWNALLRSYAMPEIYGHNVEPRGLYRMWRQVSLTVMHGRNLGGTGKLAAADGFISATSPEDDRGESATEAPADAIVFCEIVLNGFTSGRTMFQRGEAGTRSEPPNWTWLEGFSFSDLPPFGVLLVRVWRYKKSAKYMLVGTVEIILNHFRRAQAMEGWYPVMLSVPSGNSIQVGDLKLKIRVDEEIILPSDAYSEIRSALDKRNCLDLLRELDQKMQLGDISFHMLSLAVGRGTFLTDIINLAEREVDKAPNANTLFRGNSVFTKTVEQAMAFFGRPFLEASVGPCIQEICTERIELETDPSRNTKGAKDVEQSVKLLPFWCNKFWTNIYKMRDHCPPELRRLFQSIRELVERRFGSNDDSSNLKWQCVSAFCFLRLIVPAILHPHLWGLHPGLPSPGLQRSLTLIAKALQSLANLTKENKENHMRSVTLFLEQNNPAMIEYINQISSSSPDRGHPDVADRYDRLLIMQSLRDRREQLREATPLASDAIPVLPHLLDIPKHLAVLSSAVFRHSRTAPQSMISRPDPLTHDTLADDFVLKCCEIEAMVRQSVSCLGTLPSTTPAPPHSRRVHRRRSNSPSKNGRIIGSISHLPPTTQIDSRIPNAPSIPSRRRKSIKRPSTAPAAPAAPATAKASAFHSLLPSPLETSSHAPPSFNGGFSLPVSPSGKFAGNRTQIPSNIYTGQSPVSTSVSTPPISDIRSPTLHRTLSQQLDPHEIEMIEEAVAKRRGGFLRSLLSRTTK